MNTTKRKFNYYELVSIIGLIVILAIAKGSDILLTYLRVRNASTFALSHVLFGSYALLALLFAAVLLLLSWFVLIHSPKNIWVTLLYILIGFIILSFPLLYYTGLLHWFPTNVRLWLSDFLIARPMLTFSAGGFLAIIGFFNLILPKRKRTTLE